MLQQTRVDQMLPYYHRFMEAFPTVEDLARADSQHVLQLWEGLGYYSRARNLHEAARQVVDDHAGRVPDTWKRITSLKGVGPYTAAAVLSIAYGQPYAVVDGNVIRVLSRYFGIKEDVRSTAVKQTIQQQSDRCLSRERPGDFNQALMELGARVCTPRSPDCQSCPLQDGCHTAVRGLWDTIPYKSPAKKRPHHHIAVGIIAGVDGRVLIARRPDEAMLGGLWEFPGGKQEAGETLEQTLQRELREELGVTATVGKPLMSIDHGYSHFTITLHAYFCRILEGEPRPQSSQEVRWVGREELRAYPFPKANRKLTDVLIEHYSHDGTR